MELTFSNIIDYLRSLSLSEKEEVKDLLEHNIAEEKRKIYKKEYLSSKKEFRSGKLKFSNNIEDLK